MIIKLWICVSVGPYQLVHDQLVVLHGDGFRSSDLVCHLSQVIDNGKMEEVICDFRQNWMILTLLLLGISSYAGIWCSLVRESMVEVQTVWEGHKKLVKTPQQDKMVCKIHEGTS